MLSCGVVAIDSRATYPFSGELFAPILDERLDGMLVFQLLHAPFLGVHLFYSVVLRKLGQHLSSGQSRGYNCAKAFNRDLVPTVFAYHVTAHTIREFTYIAGVMVLE